MAQPEQQKSVISASSRPSPPTRNRMTRSERQTAIYAWAHRTFGDDSAVPLERLRRFVEEAAELAQAGGLPQEQVLAIVDYVYRKPAGDPVQEAGGVGVCLLAYAESKGFDADLAEHVEFDRVSAIDPEYFRQRHNAKAQAGIAVVAQLPTEKLK